MSRGPGLLLRATLRTRRREFVRLAGWSLVEAVPALLSGWLVARAVDDGFLAGRGAAGFGWLGLLACAVLVGAWGTRQVTLQLAGVVEPFRDDLVSLATTGTLHHSARVGQGVDTAGVARLTEQVEIARESYGAVVMFVQNFTVTTVSVCLGLAALDPALLLFVVPPLLAGLVLFLLALRAMADRQRAVVLADEAIAEQVSTVAGGLRDVAACGAEEAVRRRVGARVDEAAGAARALARLTALRTAALGVGGWLPIVLILAGAPWLVRSGVTAGAILGALTYVAQSLQPALRGFVQGLGGSGLWLLVTLGRILETAGPEALGASGAAGVSRTAGGSGRAGAPERDGAPGKGGAPRTDDLPQKAEAPRTVGAPQKAEAPRTNEASAASVAAPVTGTATVASARVAAPLRASDGQAAGRADGTPPADGPGKPAAAAPPRAPTPSDAPRETHPRDGRVDLRGVTFGYAPSAEPVVRGLDLSLASGTHLAVVGPSGAGKSTLAAIVAGVLEPQTGQVRLGGVPVRSLDTGGLTRSRVLIPQEAYVFVGSLRENLAYLHPTATRPALDAAVHAIGAAPLVERLGGYDAPVNPALLSAGERQLIALVRALLPPAPLVLLDEATCHLDPGAEAVAERAFASRPSTLIVCAHRISSALRADLVLVMDGPRCTLGTHERLRAECALYRDLIGHWDQVGAEVRR
ncbi:ATP-binding cassette domain-containing protein [Streptomyces cyaneochromogenes]|uniref:ATP-binding cassette domain-containing protein n=1 Tax=Streptomyces cyaneochromogenes TaxID=2496836 RepID=A0A3Q9ETD4_9ACTN|nr:ABC transporter ATP-binding protein [Streptomyces cyaneochromogenes]AZQ38787.1 ATP-binding cassette domain-containing protein [Streptomyces cyaneochromogenes]